MTTRRLLGPLFAWLAFAFPAPAQTVPLAEDVKPGDCLRVEIDLAVTGKLKVLRDGKTESLRLEAKARHRFAEKVLAVDAGLARKAVRQYDEAASATVVEADRADRQLAADRRVIVAQRKPDGLLCFNPAGPLTRDELQLVAEQFDTLSLPGLLPGKAVAVDDTWAVSNLAAQGLCQFDGLVAHTLTGKLVEVKDGAAWFAVEGTAEGIEQGAAVKLVVTARGKFDPASKRITELEWKQKDDRSQGPVSPASEVEAVVRLKRAAVEEPKELAAAALPAGETPPLLLTLLRHADADGRYEFLYPREWHVVGKTADHLVLRLIDRGELVAQATLTNWKKADAGKHADPAEFKKTLADLPGWETESVLSDGEIQTDPGRWLYRVTAKGKLDGLAVVQSYFLLAGPKGDQVVVTFAMKPDKADAVGTRDVSLVNAIEFGKK
jgi:hypothetical protein